MAMPGWPDDEIAALHRMVGLNLSASQIGQRLGRSRNAVIGKCHRLGLTLGGGRNCRQGTVVARAPKRAAPRLSRVATIAAMPVSNVRFAAPPGAPAAVAALRARQCRYPIGDTGSPDFRFCNRERATAQTSYCPEHHGACWREAKSR